MKKRTALWPGALALALVLGAAQARAAAVWPNEPWTQLMVGAQDYWDPLGDENPQATDLIGGFDDGISYSAGAWHESSANDQLSLRMRLDEDGTNSNSVWQFLFDTDTDSDIDWVLEVRQSGNPAASR
jgi:hypothetical protein